MTLQGRIRELVAEKIGEWVSPDQPTEEELRSFADALLEEVAKTVELERADSDGVHDAEYVAYNDAVVDCAHAIRSGKGK